MMSLLLLSIVCSMTLPEGPAPEPVPLDHFPDRLHAFVWRNWTLVPIDRMAAVVDATPEDVLALGKRMGLPDPPSIPETQLQRSYITIIRANWHMLPYAQLLKLLDWDEARLAYTLREDDFLFIKLGSLKPDCTPLIYTAPDVTVRARQAQIAATVHEHFGDDAGLWRDPPLSFVERLSSPLPEAPAAPENDVSLFNPRFCYSYFALYGDPLLEHDPFPDGYLQRLAAAGVNGVWLHAVLYKMTPFPWDDSLSEHWEQRLERLRALTTRAAAHNIGVYLYLNEPRTMPLPFFEHHPELRGVTAGDVATLCTSVAEVRAYVRDAVARICEAAPELAGFFTITASENLTNCWSHHRGNDCPRCAERGPAEVIAEVNATVKAGIDQADSPARLLAWDWGWREDWAPDCIAALPEGVSLMSVSEWHTPISRGGIDNTVGEYAISVVGPGPRAQRHWQAAHAHGLSTAAKIQANTTWELGALPYIPAVANVAAHVTALRDTGVTGLMLSWTLGGWPSPNLEVVHALGTRDSAGALPAPETAMLRVAESRFGPAAAAGVVEAWQDISKAFQEFPYDIGVVYNAPLQVGPANLLWAKPTGYRATMVGIPYDDLDAWRAVYPAEVFITQLHKTADGFERGVEQLRRLPEPDAGALNAHKQRALREEAALTEAAAIHYRAVAHQSRFILLRRELESADTDRQVVLHRQLNDMLDAEIALAKRLHALQSEDSRIGFEATNHYFYTPMDLVEKVVNCIHLKDLLSPP